MELRDEQVISEHRLTTKRALFQRITKKGDGNWSGHSIFCFFIIIISFGYDPTEKEKKWWQREENK